MTCFYWSKKSFGVIFLPNAPVVKSVDAPDSKSGTARCVGSSPTRGTIYSGGVPLCAFGATAMPAKAIYRRSLNCTILRISFF